MAKVADVEGRQVLVRCCEECPFVRTGSPGDGRICERTGSAISSDWILEDCPLQWEPCSDDFSSLKWKYEELVHAVKDALDGSLPYVSKYNAFLVHSKDWTKLAKLTSPWMVELEDLMQKRKRGELTEKEIDEWLKKIHK